MVLFFDGVSWLPIDTLYSTQGDCDLGAGWAHHSMNLPVTGSGSINFKIGFSLRFFYNSVRSYDIGSVAIDDIVITGHALVQDETPPVVICPGAITLGCDDFQSLADLIEVSDDLDQYPHITFSPESWNGNYENQMVEVTATDFYGNETSCSFELSFEDVIGPLLTCPNNVTIGIPINETSVLVTEMMLGEPIVARACMEYSLTHDFEEQNLGVGEYEIQWTLVDANNSSQSCFQTFFISQEAPHFVTNVFSDSIVEPQCVSIFVDDGFYCEGCDVDNIDRVTISTLTDMILMDNNDTGCANSQGYIDYDPVEGITTCSLIPGGNYKLYLQANLGFTEYYSAWIDYDRDGYFDSDGEWLGGSLNSLSSLTLDFSIPEDMALHGYYKLRVMCNFFSFDIDCNNPLPSACIFDCFGECEDYTLKIGDLIQSAPCGVLQDYSTWSLAYDDVDPNPIITQSPIAGTIIQDSVLVTITATDYDGLSSQTSFWVWNSDPGPEIVCPADTFIFLSTDLCAATITDDLLGIPIATSSCGIADIYHEDAETIYEVSNHEVIWHVVDVVGRQESCTQIVQVLDVETPDFICPSDTTIYVSGTTTSTDVEINLPLVPELCTDITFTNDHNGGIDASGTYQTGLTPVTYTFNYGLSQSASCAFDVNVSTNVCCPGDFNCDGYINILDLINIIDQFGCLNSCDADMTGDGLVTSMDIYAFMNLYQSECE